MPRLSSPCSDRLEHAVEARPIGFHSIGEWRAARLLVRDFGAQLRQRIVGVGTPLVGQKVAILGVEDEEQSIEQYERALAYLLQRSRIKRSVRLFVGGRERLAKRWEYLIEHTFR